MKVKEEVKLKFRKDYVVIVLKLIASIKERCPLKYHIVRNAVCLSPSQMIRNTDYIIATAKRLIQSLYELNLLSAAEADQAKQEYLKFMSSVVVTDKEKFFSFDQDKDRFFSSLMQANVDFFSLWKVCRIIFVLSHNQADVERGFNINGEQLVENMKELSLISQRIVCDHHRFLHAKMIFIISSWIKSCCLTAKGHA